jgi:hypothetical protein
MWNHSLRNFFSVNIFYYPSLLAQKCQAFAITHIIFMFVSFTAAILPRSQSRRTMGKTE